MKSEPFFTDGYMRVDLPEDIHVPGMLVVSPESGKRHFSHLSDSEVLSISRIERQLRIATKSLLRVAIAGLYIEEHEGRPVSGYAIPFHIDRLREQFDISIYQPHIEDYLLSYGPDYKDDRVDAARMISAHLVDALTQDEPMEPSTNTLHLAKDKLIIQEVRDIDNELELPPTPVGMKYYVCLGGSKNFQAFLVEDSLSKGEFLEMFEDEIDETLLCIYEDDIVAVRQDAKYAIPGFYIVSPKDHYRSIDEMPQTVLDHSLLTARNIQRCLTSLGTQTSHIYHDEKYNSPASAHLWVLPLHQLTKEGALNRTIHSKDIWTYLESYPRFSHTKNEITRYNDEMRNLLQDHQV